MALRSFIDAHGVAWEVWEVHPGAVLLGSPDRRVRPADEDRRVIAAPGVDPSADRRSGYDRRILISEPLRRGWLAFRSSGGERRRLAPPPSGWQEASDRELASLCGRAAPLH